MSARVPAGSVHEYVRLRSVWVCVMDAGCHGLAGSVNKT